MDPYRFNTPTNGSGQAPAARNINGKKLARALKAGTVQPGLAAWLAYEFQAGGAYLHHLTAKQARWLTGAKCADLAAERRKHRQTNGNGKRVLYRLAPTDSDLDAVIAKLGADRIMKALDRYTQPQMFAAE
jgi:hypothetical protein